MAAADRRLAAAVDAAGGGPRTAEEGGGGRWETPHGTHQVLTPSTFLRGLAREATQGGRGWGEEGAVLLDGNSQVTNPISKVDRLAQIRQLGRVDARSAYRHYWRWK